MLWFQAPQAADFNLVEAKRLRDEGEAKSNAALGDLKLRPDGAAWQPIDEGLVLDALADLSAAALFSFAAVESLANETIEGLPDESVYTDSRGKKSATRLGWFDG